MPVDYCESIITLALEFPGDIHIISKIVKTNTCLPVVDRNIGLEPPKRGSNSGVAGFDAQAQWTGNSLTGLTEVVHIHAMVMVVASLLSTLFLFLFMPSRFRRS